MILFLYTLFYIALTALTCDPTAWQEEARGEGHPFFEGVGATLKKLKITFSAALETWNSMLTPSGKKKTTWTPNSKQKMLCPTEITPYFPT